MVGTIGPDVARAAGALARNHSDRSAREALDVCMWGRAGGLADFGQDLAPGQPLAALVAEAFGGVPCFAVAYGLKL